MSEPLYYPKDGAVFRRPVTTGTGTSMGFKVCDVNPGVEPAEVAKLLNLGERYEALAKAARALADDVSKDDSAGHDDQVAAVWEALNE